MLFSESIKTALDSIKSNATRSFLTALAIIIGIASVIAMLSIGAGAQQALEDEIDALGGRILSVYAGQTRRGGVKGSYAPLEIKDAEVEAIGYEPIWSKNNKRIGMTTSGGYGHNVHKSLAMAFVEPEFSEPGIELKTHIVGKEKRCVVLGNSPWDPEGSRMRL